jgi:hypothetical protein
MIKGRRAKIGMWNEIANENDLNNFLHMFGSFHDSCIKEFKYLSGAYVECDLSMYPINNERLLKVIFQRQYNSPSVVEIEFSGLIQLNLFLENANIYTCEVLDATMIICRDRIYWCDCGGLSESELKHYHGVMICAAKARWRTADEYLGKKEVYTAHS